MDRAEIYLNETLRELRAITERIPQDARLPGSPKLTEEVAHVFEKFLEQRNDIAKYKEALKGLIENYDELVPDEADPTPVKNGAFVEVTPRNFRADNFVAEVKGITSDGRYILWYGKYAIWDRSEFKVIACK